MSYAIIVRGRLLALCDEVQEAAVLLERLENLAREHRVSPEDVHSVRGLLLAQTGTQEEWRAALDQLLEWPRATANFSIEPIATILARRGETDAAFEVLVRGIRMGPPWIPDYEWLMLSPALQSLREDPRFEPIAAGARANFESLLSIIEDARRKAEFPAYLEQPLGELLADLGLPAR